MHIPPGERLSLASIRKSHELALDFFPEYFPDRPFRGFVCGSWLFNTQFQEMLGAHSNIVRWQRQVYLLPIPSDGRGGFRFIFGRSDVDIDTAPADTRLRRGVLDIARRGEPVRSGAMFLLPEDVPQFGEQPYLGRWPEARRALGLG
jgi:hypothetical protein